jgi:protein-S-isoprenylcysteine O-methyltransferase Ste14
VSDVLVEAPSAPAPAAVPIPAGVSIANHPRARGTIRRARARAGLAGFGLVLLFALNAGVPATDSVLRALVAGTASFLVAWAIGLALWKHFLMAELRAAHERREARRHALAEAAAARAEEQRAAKAAAAAAAPAGA